MTRTPPYQNKDVSNITTHTTTLYTIKLSNSRDAAGVCFLVFARIYVDAAAQYGQRNLHPQRRSLPQLLWLLNNQTKTHLIEPKFDPNHI